MIAFLVMDRTILHMDLDSFFVSVERLKDPSLIGVPLVIGGTSHRGVVSSCSYEARKFGIHSAMPSRQAHKLCPHAVFMRGDMSEYSKYSRMVTEIIKEEAPLFEKSSIDEFYIDLTGMDRFFGSYKWATALRQRIMKETGLPISFGLSTSKMVAKVATGEAKPNGQLMVPKGTEKDFLAPMPVSKIPFIGTSACEKLLRLKVKTVGQLADADEELLFKVFGKLGPSMKRRANGIDHSLVTPTHEAKSISVERTFHKDRDDVAQLKQLISAMVEKVAFELRDDRKLASCVAVKVRYTDFTTVSKQVTIDHTASDHVFRQHALELFDKVYDTSRKLRLVGVRLSHFVDGHHQIDMFNDKPEVVQLYKALDHIKRTHGHEKIARASGWGSMSSKPVVNSFAKE